jgi:hypothetical protein
MGISLGTGLGWLAKHKCGPSRLLAAAGVALVRLIGGCAVVAHCEDFTAPKALVQQAFPLAVTLLRKTPRRVAPSFWLDAHWPGSVLRILKT